MKPAPFDYRDPETLTEAIGLLVERGDDAVIISGGQSLVPLLNLRLARPEIVIDLRRVADLDHIVIEPHRIRVGARVTARQLGESAEVRAALPGLTEAVLAIGHAQIRNRTTIGGSIAHADPASELPAALCALDGEVVLTGPDGERVVAADDFFESAYVTNRRSDEVLTEIRFTRPNGPSTWVEFATRPGDFALVGVFIAITLDDGRLVADARIALTGAGSRPLLVPGAAALLLGHSLGSPGTLDATACAAVGDAVAARFDATSNTQPDVAHRQSLARELTRQAIGSLAP